MAIGGYTTAILSRRPRRRHLLDDSDRGAITCAVGFLFGIPGAAPHGRLPRARDVRARGRGPPVRAKSSQGSPAAAAGSSLLPIGVAAGWLYYVTWAIGAGPARSSPGSILRGKFGPRAPRRARQRARRDLVRDQPGRSTRRWPSASRRATPASPGRSSRSTIGYAQPGYVFRVDALAPAPHRRRARRPRLALGHALRRALHRSCAASTPSGHRLGAGRDLRPDPAGVLFVMPEVASLAARPAPRTGS